MLIGQSKTTGPMTCKQKIDYIRSKKFKWYVKQVQLITPSLHIFNTADKMKQGDNCPMIKDVDWIIGMKIYGRKPKWQHNKKCMSIVESQCVLIESVIDMIGYLPDSQFI